jgi:hypothetical protein
MSRADLLIIHPLPLCREAIAAAIARQRPLLVIATLHPADVPKTAPAPVLLIPGEPTIILLPNPPSPRRLTCGSLAAALAVIDAAITPTALMDAAG